jgi:DNA polymerase III epsilon subunit-like protein
MIIFDTETTALIDNIAKPLKDQPQIAELYAQKLDDRTLETVGEWHSLFKVREMSADATRITGLTTEFLSDQAPFPVKVPQLIDFFLGERILVGHNLAYDRDMLVIELRRLGMDYKFPWPVRHICTVEATEAFTGYRLNLQALHEKLFGRGFDGAHRAKADVEATAACVRELVSRGVLEL